MTIYIVTSGEYSDYHINAVFASREQAALYCAIHESNYDVPEIEEWETDDGNLESVARVNERWAMHFLLSGRELNGIQRKYTVNKPGPAVIKRTRSMYMREEWLDADVVLPVDTPVDKAKKILRDAVAKWRYEHLVEGKANDT